MKIAIRTDASLHIGTGHVMRCLTLAEALRAKGTTVRFICRHLPESLASLIQQNGHQLSRLSSSSDEYVRGPGDLRHSEWLGVAQERDAQDTASLLASGPGLDWLVVDHYGLDARWESSLRPLTDRILSIDDLADRAHDCDVLLDQNYYENAVQRYGELLPADCTRLLGLRYSLIRSEFRELRRNVGPRSGEARRILVFFGGTDPRNATGAALEAMSRLDRSGLAVDVVVGKEHPALHEIERACAKLGFHCHVQTPHMAQLMANADLAIGAGGTATWERCALGLPTMTFSLAENQRRLVSDGARAGLVYAPEIEITDTEEVLRHLRILLADSALRSRISRNCLAAVDASGASRVAQRLGVSAVEIRLADKSDSDNLLAWRNHASIRAVSRDNSPISEEAHVRWLAAVLPDPQRQLLIGSRDGIPVGVVRFDMSGDTAEVSIYLVPGSSGHGNGSALLLAAEQWLRSSHRQIRTINANVLRDNAASHRLFAGCGYVMQDAYYTKSIRK